jgi:hypothetical protein
MVLFHLSKKWAIIIQVGSDISKNSFAPADFKEFNRLLRSETSLLKRWFKEGIFEKSGMVAGFELETWLVDKKYKPTAINEEFLDCLNNPLVGPELSRFNVELNSTPHPLKGKFLDSLKDELTDTWVQCRACASDLKSDLVMIGVLPTLKKNRLTLKNMSPLQRYRALNEQIFKLKRGRPMKLDIQGNDHLKTSHKDVMLESGATSLQVHLQVNPEVATRYFNASLILSAPLVALAANSPFLFGKDLWDETRIPLFEQAVGVGSFRDKTNRVIKRVTFGNDYIQKTLLELFIENQDGYPVLLPTTSEGEKSQMAHLRLHNGTIWRWNRPLIGIGPKGHAHLRIENRVSAAGPTIPDLTANMAFFLGLVHELATCKDVPEKQLAFDLSKKNFYAAAKDGLRANITWLDHKAGTMRDLLLEVLLPQAQRGLEKLGTDKEDIEFYLNYILQERVSNSQNGAAWQRRFVDKHGRKFQNMMAKYIEYQHRSIPVHEWTV